MTIATLGIDLGKSVPDSVQTSLLDVIAYLKGHGIEAMERASVNDEEPGRRY